jgi:hypothetical protein
LSNYKYNEKKNNFSEMGKKELQVFFAILEVFWKFSIELLLLLI